MKNARLIRKQSNRRLYDTVASRHVTLEELGQIIADGGSIQVIDARTDADITRSVLLQIIVDNEHPATALLSQSFLENLIRLYRDPTQGMVANYLDASLEQFSRQHADMADAWRELAAQPTQPDWTDMASQSFDNWLGMHDAMTRFWTGGADARDADAPPEDKNKHKK